MPHADKRSTSKWKEVFVSAGHRLEITDMVGKSRLRVEGGNQWRSVCHIESKPSLLYLYRAIQQFHGPKIEETQAGFFSARKNMFNLGQIRTDPASIT